MTSSARKIDIKPIEPADCPFAPVVIRSSAISFVITG